MDRNDDAPTASKGLCAEGTLRSMARGRTGPTLGTWTIAWGVSSSLTKHVDQGASGGGDDRSTGASGDGAASAFQEGKAGKAAGKSGPGISKSPCAGGGAAGDAIDSSRNPATGGSDSVVSATGEATVKGSPSAGAEGSTFCFAGFAGGGATGLAGAVSGFTSFSTNSRSRSKAVLACACS